MDSKDTNIIEHILEYCKDVDETIRRFGDNYELFCSDKDYFNSISMSVYQISELTTRLSDEFKKSAPTMGWGLIKVIRNLFAHEYHRMDKDVIWDTATNDISNLKNFCEKVVAEECDDDAR
jgi:uncharacterized protein with HEPN domain